MANVGQSVSCRRKACRQHLVVMEVYPYHLQSQGGLNRSVMPPNPSIDRCIATSILRPIDLPTHVSIGSSTNRPTAKCSVDRSIDPLIPAWLGKSGTMWRAQRKYKDPHTSSLHPGQVQVVPLYTRLEEARPKPNSPLEVASDTRFRVCHGIVAHDRSSNRSSATAAKSERMQGGLQSQLNMFVLIN